MKALQMETRSKLSIKSGLIFMFIDACSILLSLFVLFLFRTFAINATSPKLSIKLSTYGCSERNYTALLQ